MPRTHPTNLGSWMLGRTPDASKRIRDELGVSGAQLSYWRSGKRPDGKAFISDQNRRVLRDMFGIPTDAWRKPAPTTPEEEADALKLFGSAPAAAPPVTADDDASSPEALTVLIRQAITQARAIADVQDRTKTIASLTQSLERVQRTTGEHALTVAKILHHPETRRIISTIVGALAGHKEALEAVKAALAGLDS